MSEQRYEIGAKIYRVAEKNNAFGRKKIYMVDKDGVEWYRYPTSLREYHIEHHTIIGRVLHQVEGVCEDDYDEFKDAYYTDLGSTVDHDEIDWTHPLQSDVWMSDLTAANVKLAVLVEEAYKLERS